MSSDNAPAQTSEALRTRLLVRASLALGVFAACLLVIRGVSAPVGPFWYVGVVFVLSLLAIRLWIRIGLSNSTLILSYIGTSAFIIAGSAFHRGGIGTPVVMFLPVLPVMGAFFAGERGARVALGITCAVLATLGLQLLLDMERQLGTDPKTARWLQLAFLTTGSFVVFALTRIYARETRRHQEQLNRALAVKENFLATMSHEVRTPLNGILGLAQALSHTPLNPQQREVLHALSTSGTTLLALLNDVLDYSKLQAGEASLETAPFDPVDVVDECLSLFGGQAWAKDVALIGMVDAATPGRVLGDPSAFRQILINLVSNAVKFTAEGQVAVRMSFEAGRLTVRVEDSGIGIDEHQLESIFAPFAQADGATTRRFGGTGLGLPIARRLVRAMGGELVAEGQPGVGAAFSFAFPAPEVAIDEVRPILDGQIVALDGPQEGLFYEALVERCRRQGLRLQREQDAVPSLARVSWSTSKPRRLTFVGGELSADRSAVEIPTPVTQRALQRQFVRFLRGPEPTTPALQIHGAANVSVIVADDDQTNLDVIRLMLERFGFAPVLVEGGQALLDAFSHRPFDVVITDLSMPDIDGLTAVTRIRERHGTEPRIVVATANVDPSMRRAVDECGADGYIAKPILIERLREVMVEMLQTPTAAGSETHTPAVTSAPNNAYQLLDHDVDTEALERLNKLTGGKPAVLAKLLTTYIEVLDGVLIKLGHLSMEGDGLDFGLLESLGHRLAGSSGTYGAAAVGRSSRALEMAAQVKDAEQTSHHLQALLRAGDEASARLRKLIASAPPPSSGP